MLSSSSIVRLGVLVGLVGLYVVSAHGLQSQSAQGDERFFEETGYRIEHDLIWEYFTSRGGVDTLGYPASETLYFRRLPVQVFQRQVIQVLGEEARPLNLLDPDVMPIATLNGSRFPEYDGGLARRAPLHDRADYGQVVEAFLREHVPNAWEGANVGFHRYYLQAAPGASGGLQALLALEVWGFPTSAPARDPNNHDFVYLRFQRGIMHHDVRSGVTLGIRLGDAFKERLGEHLTVAPGAPAPTSTSPGSGPTTTRAATGSATAPLAVPSAPPLPTSTPGPIPTATDGRYPKPQEAGFVASVFADSAERPIEHATSLAWDRHGALYVSRMEGPIIRITADGRRTTFASNLDVPVGLAFRPGTDDLYISHRGGVTLSRDMDGDGRADVREPFLTGMFCCYAEMHQTNGLQFASDGWLYLSQGANSDHGEVEGIAWHAGILRVHPDEGQSSLEYVATGVRNGYDLVVLRDGRIFATDNGADFGPPDELNHIIRGEDYGWPYCVTNEAGAVDVHPAHGDWSKCTHTRPAIATFVPHASANGITAYEASEFPAEYRSNLFVALWSHIEGAYRIVRVQLEPSADSYAATVTPFVTDLELPLDVAVGPDGALYIADWGPGRIYRVAYEP